MRRGLLCQNAAGRCVQIANIADASAALVAVAVVAAAAAAQS